MSRLTLTEATIEPGLPLDYLYGCAVVQTSDFNTGLWLLIIGAFSEMFAFVTMAVQDQYGSSQFDLLFAAAGIVSTMAGIAALWNN